ncbi:MAG TPA: hypothetical protein VIY86_04930, partial [Pirellulaceae bacterium]
GQPITQLVLEPKGHWFAAAPDSGTLYLCEPQRLGQIDSTKRKFDSITALAIHPAGNLLAVAAESAEIHLCQVERSPDGATSHANAGSFTLTERSVLQGHTEPITSIHFSPDGRRLASLSLDRSLRLWDVRTKLEVSTFVIPTIDRSLIRFSRDGRTLWMSESSSLRCLRLVGDAVQRPTLYAASSDGARIRWHTDEAARAEQQRHWFASIFHRTRLAELEPDSWRHIALRGRAHAEQDDWSLAAADFEACRGKDPEAIVEYNRALIWLVTNQDDHYRSAVRALFDAQERTTNGVAANTTAWAACLIPKTGIDPERVVNLAQRAVDLLGTPEPLSTLGVAHYRAGQFAE